MSNRTKKKSDGVFAFASIIIVFALLLKVAILAAIVWIVVAVLRWLGVDI